MPVTKSFTRAQRDAAAQRLEALPEKAEHEHRLTIRDTLKSIQAQISVARKKGYTLEEIVEEVARAGIDVSVGTVKYALRQLREEKKIQQAPAEANRGRTTTQPHGKTATQRGTARDGSTRKQAEQSIGEPGSMVIRDAYSFQIRPDIENL